MGVDLFDTLDFSIVMRLTENNESMHSWCQKWPRVFRNVGVVKGYEHKPLR